MKTIKFFAAAAAVVACVSCGQEPTKYEALVNELKEDKELKKLEVSEEKKSEASYLLGVNAGLMMQGGLFDELKEVDMDKFNKGFEDAFAAGQPSNPYMMDSVWAKKFEVSPYEMNKLLNEFAQARHAYKAAFNKKLGEKFLADNAKNKGVKVTESGLQYKVEAEGKGDLVAPLDTITIKYTGKVINGTEFDSNDAFELQLTRLDGKNNVILGWVEGICLLKEGAKATLYIPAELGYGEEQRGNVIEPNSALIFDVEVLKVKKYQEDAAEVSAEGEIVTLQ